MSLPRSYADTASSEPLHPAARETLLAALDAGYADPRRLHHEGRRARLLLDNARAATAEALGVRDDEVTFTASGTEAVHRGLLGLLPRRKTLPTPAVAVSTVEHSAVFHALRWAGVNPLSIPVTSTGVILPSTVDVIRSEAPDPGLALAAVQLANHETGTLQDLESLGGVLDGVPLFVDACAGAGRVPLPSLWSAAAASAHKWGGPAGVGVLLVRKGARWRSPFPEDDRSDARAVGFENVPSILAAAAALQAVTAERNEIGARQHALIAHVRDHVSLLPDVEVVGEPDARLPHLVTFSCLYVDGESLVTELDRHGFAIASGSACSSSALAPSHVLEAMGVLTHGNVRLALTREADATEVDRFLAVLPHVLTELRARVGL